jgi:ABC-type molybdenum transport system ATPase subunit/photorepair protein PhrA
MSMFRSSSKKRAETLQNHALPKPGNFHFPSIGLYWSEYARENAENAVSDRMHADLDLDEVFTFIDRTQSKPGQQYLYAKIHSIPKTEKQAGLQEKLISKFAKSKKLKDACILQLAELSKPAASNITTLFSRPFIEKPSWFWAVRLMAVLSLLSTVFIIYLVPQYWFALFIVLAINFGFHYWNKQHLIEYTNSIPQLLTLISVSKKLRHLTQNKQDSLLESINQLSSLRKVLFIYNIEKGLQTDIGQVAEFFKELLWAFFLIEPLLLFHSLGKLTQHKGHIHSLFCFVGEIDSAISVLSLREQTQFTCQPNFRTEKGISTEEVYHPLLEQPVTNSLSLEGKSVLLTGSNMSGKTTFIRTIGINALLGQTINTCFARQFSMPRMHIQSAIRMRDDLMNDKSYFFQEVLTIQQMVASGSESFPGLFLLDELFKGTNTLERIAAGKAILSHLNKSNNLVFIATHDIELAEYLKSEYDLYHFSETVVNDNIEFDYLLKPGNLVNTNALKILALNGFPDSILTEAGKLIEQMKGK